ncbi:SWI SNF, matrix associated, actin dependent regulator of chromatin, sub d, member 1 [Actinomortierella ambigua]|nr:SWI SNF, matrix associated, actin dependent regulator of chromatin, sub d, member 1 [Actinomortierella ambigua]
MRERECTLEGFDKVFALTWLTDEDILLGTKCNYLMHLNTRTNRRVMLGQLGESLTWTTDEVQHHLRGYERQGAKKPIGGGSGAQGSEASRASNYHQYQQQQQQRPSSYASILSRASSGAQSTTGNGLERVTSNLGLRLFSAGRRSSTPSGIGSADLANNLSSLAIQGTFNNIQGIGVTNNSATATTATATTTNGSGVTAPLGVDHYSQQYLNPMSGGIRSIVINPSRSMVAIGAGEPYYVAIYALPEFEPIGLLHGHSDLVFSLRWVSDTVLVSASRDGSLRVWSLEAEPFTQLPSFLQPINVWKDVLTREEEKVKVRDLAYNRRSEQLMTLNTDGYVKLWDRESYQRVSKIKLVHYSEAVCLAVNPYVNLYAVGSQAHISILDPRTASAVHVMDSCDEGWGVRSLDFKSHIVTTGGGYGRLGFYDLRAQRYLDGFDQGTSNKRYRDIGYGWLNRETAMAGGMAGLPVRNAIYAMEYDDTGTRLFTAGGPLQLGLCGSRGMGLHYLKTRILIEAIVPESKLYTELVDFEKKLDATIMRKRLDLQEALAKPAKTKRTLRIFVSNLSHDQDVPEADDDETALDKGATPSWTLKVEGRLVDEANQTSYKNKQNARKFSSFFRSVMIELERDSNLYPNGNFVEWHKSPNQSDVDGFEIKRHGDENVKVKIILHIDHTPERFKLSPELAEVLALDVETRPGIMLALWQYIKFHQLQDAEDKRLINCDQKLAALFQAAKVAFPQLPELIGRFLSPPDPVVLEYTVRVDKPYNLHPFCYDLDVEVDDPQYKQKISSLLSATSLSSSTTSTLPRQIQALDETIMQHIQNMHNCKTKRDFLLRFANDPVDFLDRWIASQSRDLEVILGDSSANLEEQRRSEFYNQEWVNEAIFHYMTAKNQKRLQELLQGVPGAPGVQPGQAGRH